MRVLRARNDHEHCGVAPEQELAVTRRNRARAQWQSLPVLRLCEPAQRRRAGGKGGRESMSHLPPRLEFPEPERYELSEPPQYRFELNRREFVQTLGAGLLISMVLPDVFGQRRGRPAEAS